MAALFTRLIPQAIGIVQSFLFREQERFHFRQLAGIFRIIGQIELVRFWLIAGKCNHRGIVVLLEQLIRVFGEIEELSFAYGSIKHIIFDQLPVALFHTPHARLGSAAIDAIEKSGVPNTELRVPEKKGQGRWTGLAEVALQRDLPSYATLSNMSGYWGTTAGIESFDAELATRQLDTLAILLQALVY